MLNCAVLKTGIDSLEVQKIVVLKLAWGAAFFRDTFSPKMKKYKSQKKKKKCQWIRILHRGEIRSWLRTYGAAMETSLQLQYAPV